MNDRPPPDDLPDEQLNLWPNPNSSNSGSTSRHRHRTSNRENPTSQKLSQDLQQIVQAIARLGQQQQAIQTEVSNNKAILQELLSATRNLTTLSDSLSELLATDESGKSAEILLDSLKAIERKQELSIRQQVQTSQQMTVALESKLKLFNHPIQVLLNGRQLSIKTAIPTLLFISLSSTLLSLFLIYRFAPPLLDKLPILQRINGRVNNLEINQRKILEQAN